MTDYLLVDLPEHPGFRHEIDRDVVSIGRSRENDVVIRDQHVSRHQAEIARRADGLYITHIGSSTRTYINDHPISGPTLLHSGDRIQLGETTIVLNSPLPNPLEFIETPAISSSGATLLPVESIATPVPAGLISFDENWSFSSMAPHALQIILEADRELVCHRPLHELLDKIMDLVARVVHYEHGFLIMLSKGRLVPQVVRVTSTETSATLFFSRTIADQVIKKREAILTPNALEDERFRGAVSIQAHQIHSVMAVPLWNYNEVLGLIYVDNPPRTGEFKQEDLLLLTHLAVVAAAKIEHHQLCERNFSARFMELDLQRAAEIQKHLLPLEAPAIPGYGLHGFSLPCHSVGGDAFQYIALPGGRFGIGLGDVAGKGLSSALLMCTFQATMRALSEMDLPPDETLNRLNALIHEQFPLNRFVTFFYGVLDPARHSLTYANAGHDPPMLVREREVMSLPSTGGPVGSFPEIHHTSRSIELEPGDTLVCYSDGVTDSRSLSGEMFGRDRLVDLVREVRESTPLEVGKRIEEELDAFHIGAPQHDDVTLVVLKRENQEPSS